MTSSMMDAPRLRIGYAVGALPVLALVFTAALKIGRNPDAVAAFVHDFGLAEGWLAPLGALELVCAALYVVPRSALVGAILCTGYFGGAIVMELKAERMVMVPTLLAVAVWIGLA